MTERCREKRKTELNARLRYERSLFHSSVNGYAKLVIKVNQHTLT